MVNLLPFENREGNTVYINQKELSDRDAVAARLGVSTEEFNKKYFAHEKVTTDAPASPAAQADYVL